MKTILALVLFSFIFSSCTKSPDPSNPNDPSSDSNAQFTLVGAPGDCSSANLNGQYRVGIILNSSNTLSVNVVFQKPGYYRLYTDTINGIFFFIDTNFSNVGSQTIKLNGFGTPLNTGIFSFKLKSKTNNCQFALQVATLQRYGSG